jgi:hypothetical protein
VIVWMVLKVGKLLLCCEGSGYCVDGGGSVFGSVFRWWLGVFSMGHVICAIAEGRLWMVGLDEFGLWWRCDDMIDNMTKVVYDCLVGALVLDGSASTKGSMMMMTVMVVASCVVDFFDRGWVQRLVLLLSHLFLGLKEYCTISCHVVCISFMIHIV